MKKTILFLVILSVFLFDFSAYAYFIPATRTNFLEVDSKPRAVKLARSLLPAEATVVVEKASFLVYPSSVIVLFTTLDSDNMEVTYLFKFVLENTRVCGCHTDFDLFLVSAQAEAEHLLFQEKEPICQSLF